MKLLRKSGSTSEIWQIFVRDSSSTTGGGLTGLTNASSGLTAYYHRDTDTTAVAISLVSMTVGTFTSSGFKEIDSTNMPGWYQFCPPNAALASGAKSCGFHLKGVTNMAPVTIEVDLQPDVNVTHIAGTAQTARDIGASVLIAAASVQAIWDALTSALTTSGSIGKLLGDNINATIGSRASQASVDTVAGYIDTEVATIVSQTTASAIRTALGLASNNLDTQLDALPTNAELATALGTADDAVLAAIAALSIPTAAQNATAVLTTQMTESYRASDTAPTLAQACFELIAHMGESSISGTTKTLKKINGSTTAKTYTLNDATTPTAITEAT